MGDMRASIKIEAEICGVKDTWDTWINYSPNDCCGVDERVLTFFRRLYARASARSDKIDLQAEKERKEEAERDMLARLKEKYPDG